MAARNSIDGILVSIQVGRGEDNDRSAIDLLPEIHCGVDGRMHRHPKPMTGR